MRKAAQVVERELLERIAAIIGPSSAAALALAEADRHGGPVVFWLIGTAILVDKRGANA